jgi:hypothetical protein
LDIAFPSQIEVRVNGEEVKANYKGLKNKPGSTRPVDITNLTRITPANYRNSLTVTYALTQKASPKEVFFNPLALLIAWPKLTCGRSTLFSSIWCASFLSKSLRNE